MREEGRRGGRGKGVREREGDIMSLCSLAGQCRNTASICECNNGGYIGRLKKEELTRDYKSNLS